MAEDRAAVGEALAGPARWRRRRCGLVAASSEGLDMLGSVLPLQIASGHAFGAFSAAQLDALSYLSLQLQHTGLLLSLLFWGLDEILAVMWMATVGLNVASWQAWDEPRRAVQAARA